MSIVVRDFYSLLEFLPNWIKVENLTCFNIQQLLNGLRSIFSKMGAMWSFKHLLERRVKTFKKLTMLSSRVWSYWVPCVCVCWGGCVGGGGVANIVLTLQVYEYKAMSWTLPHTSIRLTKTWRPFSRLASFFLCDNHAFILVKFAHLGSITSRILLCKFM